MRCAVRDSSYRIARVRRGLFFEVSTLSRYDFVLLLLQPASFFFLLLFSGGVRSPCGGTDWLSPLWVVGCVKSAGEKRPQSPSLDPLLVATDTALWSTTIDRFGVEAHRPVARTREQ